MSVQNYRR